VAWTQALHPCAVLDELIDSVPRAKLITAVRAWGQAMATLHRWSTRFGTVPLAAKPWILTPDATPGHLAEVVPGSDLAAVLAELRSNPAIRSALSTADQSWTARHWIHGDANTANAVARAVGPYQWRVWFVDLESAGLGSPSWDLATAYDSLECHGLTHRLDVRPSLGALLDGYRSAAGPARLTRAILVARAALTAVQVAASTNPNPAVRNGVTAENFLRRVWSLTVADPAPVSPRQVYLPDKSRPMKISA
jgi:Ser/Thr protein kinase RdoA (MazF antagonist)